MRNKAPLALLEQILMLLIFALAAVVCLRVFLWSDDTSRHSADRDETLVHAQTVAETVKAHGGDFAAAAAALHGTVEDGALVIEGETYTLRAEKEVPAPYLGRAEIVVEAAGEVLFTLPIAWQEVGS
ncbi:MAG: hypothetical protein IJO41_06170 [Oscillospiraceae bacterium]|nr:hypothetical protein [Oscillospiraceae bacterium]